MNTIQRLSAPVARLGGQLKEKAKALFSRWEVRSYILPRRLRSVSEAAPPERFDQKSLQGSQGYKVSTTRQSRQYIKKGAPPVPGEIVDTSEKNDPLSANLPASPPLEMTGTESPTTGSTEGQVRAQHQSRKEQAKAALKGSDNPVRIGSAVEEPLDSSAVSEQETSEAEEFREDLKQQKLETTLATGALGTAAATGAGLAFASEVNDRPSFDHILQKDTPMDQMVIFSQHNALAMPGKGSLPFAATNQSMGIGETLEKTPVRAFDFDLWERDSGEVVINHGGFYDPLVPESKMPTLADAVTPIRRWLDKPQNSHEVVILTFENKGNLDQGELQSLLGDRLISNQELSQLRRQLGHVPTINELTADGPKVIVTDSTYYQHSGVGSVNFGFGDMTSIWEDRTIAEAVDDQTFDALADKVLGNPDPIAPQITTEDVDQLVGTGRGRYISLDQISANDPRFLKPEDRVAHGIDTDNQVFGHFYYGNEHFQSAVMGLGAAATTAGGLLGLAGGIFQGVNNERTLRRQNKQIPRFLENLDLIDVMQSRKRFVDTRKRTGERLNEAVTPEELKRLYLRRNKSEITRKTLMPGLSTTASLTGSLLGLGMIFAPVFPVLAGLAGAVGLVGAASTLGAVFGNRKRLQNNAELHFSTAALDRAVRDAAEKLERERKGLLSGSDSTTPEASARLLSKAVKRRKQVNRLNKASHLLLGGSMVVRISGLSKYGIPMLGSVAMGIGAALTGILSVVSAAVNFRERRNKLQNLPETVSEVINPGIDKRRFWLFGPSRFERFLKVRWPDLQDQHKVLSGVKAGEVIKQMRNGDLAPEMVEALQKCRRSCSVFHWEKALSTYARRKRPPVDFQTIRNYPEKLKPLLKDYAVKKLGDYAHDDTFRSGRNNTLRLAMLPAFASVFYLPLLGVAAGTLAIGLGVSKAVAMAEKLHFRRRLRRVMDKPRDKPEEKVAQQRIEGLVEAWGSMLSAKT